jgi:hypothetical protein
MFGLHPHTPRRLITRFAVGAGLLAMLGGGALAATAGPASAAPLHPEYFNLSFPAGTGTAYGPVHGAFTDNEISDTAGVWTFALPPGRVLVRHTAVDQPVINPLTCSGFAFQEGRWLMTGLTGRDRHAFGFGRFQVVTFEQVKRVGHHHHGTCDANDVLVENVYVTGQGLAANGH